MTEINPDLEQVLAHLQHRDEQIEKALDEALERIEELEAKFRHLVEEDE